MIPSTPKARNRKPEAKNRKPKLPPVHLCQPDGAKSCAACCGIYNFKANDRDSVRRRLERNTRALAGLAEDDASSRLARHAEAFRPRDNGPAKRFETVFNCEYAGFLDAERRRPGCLLHPACNGQRDLRDSSFYGKELCAGHFCLSYHYLAEREQRLVVESLDDWYLYGLVITDIDLVKGYFRALADKVGEAIRPERARAKGLREEIRRFFQWKESWPFRSSDPGRFGKYRFDGEDYGEADIRYFRRHRPPSPYHDLFKALESDFRSGEDADRAEAMIRKRIEDFARLYEKD